jgi:hypothetical protein
VRPNISTTLKFWGLTLSILTCLLALDCTSIVDRQQNLHQIIPSEQLVFNKLPYQIYFAFIEIVPMRLLHFAGPISCTELPFASTATVTGMSSTPNS